MVTLPALVATVRVDVVRRGVSTTLRLLNKVPAPVVMVSAFVVATSADVFIPGGEILHVPYYETELLPVR